ncbi:hypothetical protein C3743_09905 [Burkholderia contaminans]|uniref:Uncharacterized protein n=1 Tax=Burkholderia contaminans TaxID=488447 RepID=A0A2S5E638_9BURK|nr:hypothetical protein C3743_09905 [Burkholderia contaminans]
MPTPSTPSILPDRQTDRPTDRQTDRPTDRQTDRPSRATPDPGTINRTQYDSAVDAGDRCAVTARPHRPRSAKLVVSRTNTAAA